MGLPQVLSDWTDTLRAEVHRASVVSWRVLPRNAESCLDTLRSFVKPSPDIDSACAEAVTRCRELANDLAGRGFAEITADAAPATAKDKALAAIDSLERVLTRAEPSQKAVYLGLGWA